MADVAKLLMEEVAPVRHIPHNKITIVGVGQVGMACAYSILQQVRNFKVFENAILRSRKSFLIDFYK